MSTTVTTSAAGTTPAMPASPAASAKRSDRTQVLFSEPQIEKIDILAEKIPG